MSSFSINYAASLPLLWTLIHGTSATPISTTLHKRGLSSGATAGLGIGIAIVIIAVIVGVAFFIINRRRQAHNEEIDRERAILAGEKNSDGTDKVDKYAPEPEISAIPRRNKSVKDRLMGPLYRGSMIEMPPMPPRARLGGGGSNRQSTMTVGDGESFLNKPWAGIENSPRPSFSSKRATRMMMMM